MDIINIYAEPSFRSERAGRRRLDQLLSILEEVEAPTGPANNPIWYRVMGGYAHSGRMQKIPYHPPNPILASVPENGVLGEITVPYTRAYRYRRAGNWQRLYRLYYSSVHWIKGIDEGPDGRPWYRLIDHYINTIYHAPAVHFRPIPEEEYSPITPEVPRADKRIRISISDQTLVAYEEGLEVFRNTISSGVPNPRDLPEDAIPTETPIGNWTIQTKMPSRHMGDGRLTDDIYAYELPGVPWTMVFHDTGAALHGTYWHQNFGVRMSRGCVNLRNDDAKWLFRWALPVYDPSNYFKREGGTLIQVIA
jgi:hypothetical protein